LVRCFSGKSITLLPPHVIYFKAKTHQIRYQLRLRPRPRWGSLQRSPDALAGFKGPTSKGRGGEGKGRGPEGRGEGVKRKGEGERRVGEGEGGEGEWGSPTHYFRLKSCIDGWLDV